MLTVDRLSGKLYMSDPREKRAVEIQDSIRQILFHEWDPFEVNENPNLEDEYDHYITPVYRILVGSRSEEELIHLLEPNFTGSTEKLSIIAQKLLALNAKL
jgi:hypothetical protein